MKPFQFFPDIVTIRNDTYEAGEEQFKTMFPDGVFPPHQSPPPLSTQDKEVQSFAAAYETCLVSIRWVLPISEQGIIHISETDA
jgi:hypothetical protein